MRMAFGELEEVRERVAEAGRRLSPALPCSRAIGWKLAAEPRLDLDGEPDLNRLNLDGEPDLNRLNLDGEPDPNGEEAEGAIEMALALLDSCRGLRPAPLHGMSSTSGASAAGGSAVAGA